MFGWRFGTVGKNTVPNLVNGQIAGVLSGSPDYAQVRYLNASGIGSERDAGGEFRKFPKRDHGIF
ncbi:hypothetical protein [Xylella fastidiosa]|uniref:hypothetical protein n=1 Tax=Xylella fastidiosa TaxID=2371 RepID=UPI000A50F390|nr:hypothetical protein [Xylella fastidiosa]QTX27103.1 hypothetical protein KBP49_05580 [Xylella fastidiosa subsp. multiplex]